MGGEMGRGGSENGWGGRGRRQTRDLVTGVIVNGVNCHLARTWPPNVFMNHDGGCALARDLFTLLKGNPLPTVLEEKCIPHRGLVCDVW